MQDKQQTMNEVEASIGTFSDYDTTEGNARRIPFEQRPAQKYLEKLGVPTNRESKLSNLSFKSDQRPISRETNSDITIDSTIGTNTGELTITGKRVTRLAKSAKTFVNTDVMPQGTFKLAIESYDYTNKKEPQSGLHFYNLSVGVCHAQEIDLLVQHTIKNTDKAVAGPRTGTINVDDPAMVLLSTPALNCGRYDGGHGKGLPEDQKEFLVNGMYSVICHAAEQMQCEALTLTAAGLGVYEGNPDHYYKALFEQALKHPDLYIFYHPGKYVKYFSEKLEEFTKANPNTKLRMTTKDVFFLADELTKKGIRTACHNPSDPKVVFSQYDIGKFWKQGCTQDGFVGEEYDGAMSTAPGGSFGLNPTAYTDYVEISFGKKLPLAAPKNPPAEEPKTLAEAPKPEKTLTPATPKVEANDTNNLVKKPTPVIALTPTTPKVRPKVLQENPTPKTPFKVSQKLVVEEESESMEAGFILDFYNNLSTGEKISYAIFGLLLFEAIVLLTLATAGVALVGAAAGAILTAGIAGASVGGAGLLATGGYSFFARREKEPFVEESIDLSPNPSRSSSASDY